MTVGLIGHEAKEGIYTSIGSHNRKPIYKSRQATGDYCLHNSRKEGVRWTILLCKEMSKSEKENDSLLLVINSKKVSKCPENIPSKHWMVFISGKVNSNVKINVNCATPS